MKINLKKYLQLAVFLPFFLVALLLYLWCIGIIAYTLPGGNACRWGWGSLFTGVYLGCWFFVPYRIRALAYFLAALPLLIHYALLRPDPATVYQTPWARMPEFEFREDGLITVRNIRDFHYRSESDFDVRYATRTFDPAKAEKIYLALSHWDGLQAIAHTMLTFFFSDGQSVTISVETRIPVGKEQSTIAGLFKQFGLIMVYGTESDLLKLRATYRGETVYLYPTTATPEASRIAFINLAHRAEQLRRQPEFYNTLTGNCTTTLIPPLLPILPAWKPDWRVLLNGESDLLCLQLGYLDFRDLADINSAKEKYRIRAGHPEEGEAYSRAIRK